RQSCTSYCFDDCPTTQVSTLSLHDALPIFRRAHHRVDVRPLVVVGVPRVLRHLEELVGELEHVVRVAALGRGVLPVPGGDAGGRSEEHTSELQSRENLVCRLLLEKKKQHNT